MRGRRKYLLAANSRHIKMKITYQFGHDDLPQWSQRVGCNARDKNSSTEEYLCQDDRNRCVRTGPQILGDALWSRKLKQWNSIAHKNRSDLEIWHCEFATADITVILERLSTHSTWSHCMSTQKAFQWAVVYRRRWTVEKFIASKALVWKNCQMQHSRRLSG